MFRQFRTVCKKWYSETVAPWLTEDGLHRAQVKLGVIVVTCFDSALYYELPSLTSIVSGYAVIFSVIGMINQYLLLSQFGISLGNYADIDDFLIASTSVFDSSDQFDAVFVYGVLIPIVLPFLRAVKLNKDLHQDPPLEKKEQDTLHSIHQIQSKAIFWFFLSITPVVAWWHFEGVDFEKIPETLPEVSVELRPSQSSFRSHPIEENKNSQLTSRSKVYLVSGLNAATFFIEITEDGQRFAHAIPTSAIAQIRYLNVID